MANDCFRDSDVEEEDYVKGGLKMPEYKVLGVQLVDF